MSRAIFLGGPHVEDDDLAPAHARHELRAVDSLGRALAAEHAPHRHRELGEVLLGEPAHRHEEARHVVAREVAGDVQPAFLRLDEPSLAQDLEVLRRVSDAEPGQVGQVLDRARCLAQKVEQVEALRACERLPDPRELLVDGVLVAAMRGAHGWSSISENTEIHNPSPRVPGGPPHRLVSLAPLVRPVGQNTRILSAQRLQSASCSSVPR